MTLGRRFGSSLGVLLFTACGLVVLGPGCGAETDTAIDEQDVVPDGAQTPWDLAGLCTENIQRHITVRPQELSDGVVRWQCGDRPGVDGVDDRGQEYCEYFAVSAGKRVDNFADADPSAPLSCFFTSVYMDVTEDTVRDGYLAQALSTSENLAASVDADLVRMKGQFNSRGAATTLVVDAMNVATSQNDQRQAACFLASVDPANKANAEKLKAACRGVKLTSSTAWKKAQQLGAKIPKSTDANYDTYKDTVACMSVGRLEHGGVDWRMSDPHIAQVVVRANDECGCTYSALPDALEGFIQGTWSSKDALPAGCRRVKVDGSDYVHMTICEIPEAERSDLETNLDYSENLQAFCNDRFGKDIVLTAPLRAVETAGSCSKTTTAFCKEFTKNAVK
ncbi:MAG: hypothetical protein IPM79_31925 [Polyangiaceae bacterium]|nr:hypothetical protein [Polyangiaceae bacterium]MBK8942091.1 hypothetical protein [Polyangiaceae bacterium]